MIQSLEKKHSESLKVSMEKAFAPYYTTTLLANTVNSDAIYNIVDKIQGYYIINPMDVDDANKIIHKKKITNRDKQNLIFLFRRTENELKNHDIQEQLEFRTTLKHFVRFYEFLLQVSSLNDTALQKEYDYISYLLKYIDISEPGQGYDLTNKIKASNFAQNQTGTHTSTKRRSDPSVKLPIADNIKLSEEKKERLSQIIADINNRTGSNFDTDVATKSMLQIKDIMMKSPKLKSSATNNSEKDFELSYFDNLDDVLIQGLSQNREFFTLLLDNPEMKKTVLGIFADEIYNALRNSTN